MAVIYLKHPVHGAKIATMEAEAEVDEQNGWERFDPDQKAAPATPSEPVEEVQVAETAEANFLQPKRRGRPPREIAA